MNELTQCPAEPTFWRFVAAATAGGAAAAGAAWIVRRTITRTETRYTAETIAKVAAFWLIGGLAWIVLEPRR